MVAPQQPARVALVVHPTRQIAAPLETLERWAGEHGLDIVQIPAVGCRDREVAPRGELEPGDLVVALGGEGTVLSALRAAPKHNAPVMGWRAEASVRSRRCTAMGSTRRWNACVAATGRRAGFQRWRSIPRMPGTSGR